MSKRMELLLRSLSLSPFLFLKKNNWIHCVGFPSIILEANSWLLPNICFRLCKLFIWLYSFFFLSPWNLGAAQEKILAQLIEIKQVSFFWGGKCSWQHTAIIMHITGKSQMRLLCQFRYEYEIYTGEMRALFAFAFWNFHTLKQGNWSQRLFLVMCSPSNDDATKDI